MAHTAESERNTTKKIEPENRLGNSNTSATSERHEIDHTSRSKMRAEKSERKRKLAMEKSTKKSNRPNTDNT
jgi:hypothetical protein